MNKGKTKKINLNFFITLLFFVFISAGNAVAATYYVSPTGSDSNSGLIGAPFRTIQKAANIVNPGDTVIVKNGTYTDSDGDGNLLLLKRGGTSSNWITFRSENKWGAVLDGQGSKAVTFGVRFVTGAKYIQFEGFEIKRAWRAGIHINDEYVSNIDFYGNKISACGRHKVACDPTGKSGDSGSGIFLGKFTGITNIIFDSNVIHDNGRLPGGCGGLSGNGEDYRYDHGIYIVASGVTILNNVFYNNNSGWQVLIGTDSSNVRVLNNTFYGVNPYYGGAALINNFASGASLQNNIAYNPQKFFIRNRSAEKGKPGNCSNCTVQNNLAYKGDILNYTGGISVLKNNITGQDPKFVDPMNRNFRLQAGSPAIDKGIPISGYNHDADGSPIVGAPDIGAFEYIGKAGSTGGSTAGSTSLSAPTGLTATAISSSQISLSWVKPATRVGVAGYKVYRNGTLKATVSTPYYTDAGLSASTSYSYKVSAFDSAGNTSGQSSAVSATTKSSSSTTTPTTTRYR